VTTATREQSTNNREVAKLGDGNVFVKRTPSGSIYAVMSKMTLREDHSEIAVIEGKPMIAADGYYRLNQITSLAILTPDTIHIPWRDGTTREVPNPFPIIDEESGTQKGVWVKKTVVGYSPTGTLAISSSTLFYNFTTYFLQDLQKKVTYNQGAGRLCFEHQLTDQEQENGIFLKIEGALGIYANMEHTEVLKAVSTWLQNKNFGERKAQTICERNALKHHPALAVKITNLRGPQKQRQGDVTVVGWQHDLSRQDLEDIAAQADAGEEVVVGGKAAEVVETTGTVSDEDVVAGEELDEETIRARAEAAGEDDNDDKGQRRLF